MGKIQEFQYDPQHRRHVEGWNIICFHGEDKIGLTAKEYEELAADFLASEMDPEAEECCHRAIRLGSVAAISYLGDIYKRRGKMENAYHWYLEGALANDRNSILKLADFYEYGIFVKKDRARAEELRNREKAIERNADNEK